MGISAVNEIRSAEADTYLEQILSQSSVRLGAQEGNAKIRFINEMVDAGQWSISDVVQIYATIEGSDANLVHDLKAGTTYGGAVVNVLAEKDIEGAKGNATDALINTGFIQSADRVNFELHDAAIHTKWTGAPGAASQNPYQAVGAAGSSRIRFEAGASVQRFRLNNTQNLELGLLLADIKGKNITHKRPSVSNQQIFIDGVLTVNATNAVGGTVTPVFFPFLGANSNGTLQSFTDAKLALGVLGSAALDAEFMSLVSEFYLLTLKGYNVLEPTAVQLPA